MTINVSVTQRSGRPGFYMQYRDTVSGNKVRRSCNTKDRRKAERMAGKWQEELEQGTYAHRGRIAWEEFRFRYEGEELAGLADNTFKKAVGVLNVFQRQTKIKRLGDVNEDVLALYVKKLRRLGRSENTIKSHLDHLKAAFNWAKRRKLLANVPGFPKLKRAGVTTVMRGRAITDPEFSKLVEAVPKALTSHNCPNPSEEMVDSWRFFLRGLWWSGLRLEEALNVHWTDDQYLCVVKLESEYPMLWIPAAREKGHKDRLMPMAPEFVQFLRRAEPEQEGFVFNPQSRRPNATDRIGPQQAGKVISSIGESAGVRVNNDKFASAHDLRRSFGLRWAKRIMPADLQELMRHASIQTTMKYYVGRQAESAAKTLWAAVGAQTGARTDSEEVEEVQTT